ncbi:nitrate/sulfonate/bicarbonate ABC transporter ATP-binding protein [Streptomyces sp. NPDC059853]|uniref:ABC transporter ATP-binding protein n=1 Tax=Streptomyces sp. NPDC059853 TaxID=3346973 RepID=UPI003654D3DF
MCSAHEPAPILAADSVTQTFTTPGGRALPVLDGVSFRLADGEIVALLGKSGSGKSTLLRCAAGLITPSSGTVDRNGSVAMVFQSFALLPWLTVRQNVELGLQAQGVPPAERRRRALDAIDMIGLDGFEGAYPRELSGGMRQRVGFARALVVEPDALLMDEPFSALDVLTAENLRSELLSLWEGHTAPVKSILLVTHNIEEAVLLADRVLVLSDNPGRIRAEFGVDLPRPRDRHGARFEELVDAVYDVLTGRAEPATAPPPAPTPISSPLPRASVGGMAGLLEILAARGGTDGLAEIAEALTFEIDDLLPLVDAAVLLGLAGTARARISLTPAGREFTAAGILRGKELFSRHALARAPLVQAIVRALRTAPGHTLREDFFLDLLHRGFTPGEARAQLDIAVDWGRYAELYDYDSDTGTLTLEEPTD